MRALLEAWSELVSGVGDGLSGGNGVQIAVLEILVQPAMNMIGSGHNQRVELSAGGVRAWLGVNSEIY